ncbi:MAG: N-acetyl-gamma-glutamyl-phosphate reductase [Clostridiales bacterium 38_11]|nr:MAG: N-acetyl-gamma-glutamyl-phosphate reductase [Clostridiales bacterium 38_11]HBH12250.1 N-acetyl-gamma-glutamyl-phosphate reductase [Clostridiales bacterium]
MIKAGIIGGTGYAGQELVRLLLMHPNVEISFISSSTHDGENYSKLFMNYYNILNIKCIEAPYNIVDQGIDVLFIALPHNHSSKMLTREILEKLKIIDLSADFRLSNVDTYNQWYNSTHPSPDLVDSAVYGLCELNREAIKKANLIANPGCYTTCSILSLAPLLIKSLIDLDSIMIDAKSGITGAGKNLSQATHYAECNENMNSYNPIGHRHIPEIEENLSLLAGQTIKLSFVPHLMPVNRGILTTIYCKPNQPINYDMIREAFTELYSEEKFVRILPKGISAETKWVKGSNYMDIGMFHDERTNRIILTSALDNLIKGAAGQAVQNMNIMFGLKEEIGLDQISMFPI